MTKRFIFFIWALLLLLPAGLGAQVTSRSRREEALLRLEIAQGLYDAGDYERCLKTLDGYIEDHRSKSFVFPHTQMARIYGMRALLAYAFRGEGDLFREDVREYLLAAVAEDPEMSLGSPSEIPVFVQEMFLQVRSEYLEQFSRTRRRFQIGLLVAMVIDPTEVIKPSVLQPGIYFSYNISEALSLISDLRLPLSLPIWKSIRGAVGLSWYPYYNISRINPSIALSYVFSLDNLETYTHSISLAGRVERLSRAGIGIGMRVEVLRLDLILGLTGSEDLPTYRSTELFGESALRASFANINLYVYYNF
jgi:hypothetical protein